MTTSLYLYSHSNSITDSYLNNFLWLFSSTEYKYLTILQNSGRDASHHFLIIGRESYGHHSSSYDGVGVHSQTVIGTHRKPSIFLSFFLSIDVNLSYFYIHKLTSTVSSTQKLTFKLTPVAPISLQESIVLPVKAVGTLNSGKVALKSHFVPRLVLQTDIGITRNFSSDNSLPTVSLVDIIFIPCVLEAGGLDLVVSRELQSVLLGYPPHEAGGVGDHRRVLS